MEKRSKGERKPSEIIVERVNSQGHQVKFRVIDNAQRLHAKVSLVVVVVVVVFVVSTATPQP